MTKNKYLNEDNTLNLSNIAATLKNIYENKLSKEEASNEYITINSTLYDTYADYRIKSMSLEKKYSLLHIHLSNNKKLDYKRDNVINLLLGKSEYTDIETGNIYHLDINFDALPDELSKLLKFYRTYINTYNTAKHNLEDNDGFIALEHYIIYQLKSLGYFIENHFADKKFYKKQQIEKI